MIATEQLIKVAEAPVDVRSNRERMQEVIDNLTPEQQEIWDNVAPGALDADRLGQIYMNTGGNRGW